MESEAIIIYRDDWDYYQELIFCKNCKSYDGETCQEWGKKTDEYGYCYLAEKKAGVSVALSN